MACPCALTVFLIFSTWSTEVMAPAVNSPSRALPAARASVASAKTASRNGTLARMPRALISASSRSRRRSYSEGGRNRGWL